MRVFQGTVGPLSERFLFFLLHSLRNVLYTFFDILIFSYPPSTKSTLRRFQYLTVPSKSQFLSESQPSNLACQVPQTLLWLSITQGCIFTTSSTYAIPPDIKQWPRTPTPQSHCLMMYYATVPLIWESWIISQSQTWVILTPPLSKDSAKPLPSQLDWLNTCLQIHNSQPLPW
jgi:hypothetical protein